MKQILPQLIGGIGLFLYAIYQLSKLLKALFSDRAKELVKKYTSNAFLALGIGTIVTIILASSSAVIIMLIVFINSKVLSFRQSMAIILGANVGTTFSSKIIVLEIGRYSIIPLLLGFFVMLLTNNRKIKNVALCLMYFGMLFFGLFIIEESVSPLRENEFLSSLLLSIENNAIKGALVGGLITLIIQSSSATVGMAIILGKQKILTLVGGLAIMLGAELGTCFDTLLATIKGSRQALKAALFHLSFSLISIIITLILFIPFVELVQRITTSQDIGNQIANGHILFNVLGALICLPFLNLYEKVLNKILPEKQEN